MLNVHAYLLRTDEKMAATIGFERSLAPPASDAAEASMVQLQRRFLGLVPESAPPWTLKLSNNAQLDTAATVTVAKIGATMWVAECNPFLSHWIIVRPLDVTCHSLALFVVVVVHRLRKPWKCRLTEGGTHAAQRL